ncbi:MAG: hypothetical protein V7707_08225 [Motiliproteus sp.]
MNWQPLTLIEPTTAATASGAADSSLDEIPAELSAADGALGAIAGRSKWQAGALAGGAASIEAQRTALAALLNSGGQLLTLHPWTRGAADSGTGLYGDAARGYLSPQQAVQALGDKLTDVMDSGKDGAGEILLVMISGNNYGSWAQSLAALNAVLPLADLPLCQRRAEQLAALEDDKLQRLEAPNNPHWRQQGQPAAADQLRTTLGAVLARVEALANDSDPLAELQGFLTRRGADLADRRQSWADLQVALAGGAGVVWSDTAANPQALAQALQQIEPPNPGAPLCALVAMTGPTGCFTFIKEVLGL